MLSSLLRDLESVKVQGKELARYFCDDRDDFLETVFLEIKNFSDEFGKTVKVGCTRAPSTRAQS